MSINFSDYHQRNDREGTSYNKESQITFIIHLGNQELKIDK